MTRREREREKRTKRVDDVSALESSVLPRGHHRERKSDGEITEQCASAEKKNSLHLPNHDQAIFLT